MAVFNRKNIIKSINKGAYYLMNMVNDDGGVKFEDESSVTSGAWVTAEVLEALLSSTVLPLPSYKYIEPMIGFLVQSQNEDGSWNVLIAPKMREQPSPISTGHCTYSLKLAMRGGYLKDQKVITAIEKGEQWLRSNNCRVEKDGYTFWTAAPGNDISLANPNVDERSRMGYIFSSFYAVMGFVNPPGYKVHNDEDTALLYKAARFFRQQAEFFAEKYRLGMEQLNDNSLQFTKVASTICRLIYAIDFLNIEVSEEMRNRLHDVLLLCAKNPFMTTSITVQTNISQGYYAAYNNNTPFDMANAFLSIGANSDIVQLIISKYIKNQNSEGFWFLNFSSAYKIKTWTTAEAIIVLNRALEKYIEIKHVEIQNNCELRVQEFEKKYKKLRTNSLISTITSIVLSIIDIVVIILWISTSNNKDTFWGNVLTILIIPLVLWIIGKLWDIIKNYSNK